MSYFSLCLDEMCLKCGPCFLSNYFVVPFFTVFVEQPCVEDDGVE